MHTTIQLIDAIAAKHGNATDYRLSKLFCTSPQTVSHWRKGRNVMGTDFATRAATLLDWDPAYVVACVEHERTLRADPLERTGEVLATWERIADRFRPAVTSILLGCAVLVASAFDAENTAVARATEMSDATSPRIHYTWVRHHLRLLRRWLSTIFPAIDVHGTLAGAV